MANVVFVHGNIASNRTISNILAILYPGIAGGPFKTEFHKHHVPDEGYLEMPENILDLCMLTESVLQNAPPPCYAATETVVREFVVRAVVLVLMWSWSAE